MLGHAQLLGPPAAPGKVGDRRQGRRRGAIAADQVREGDRTDALGAGQPQPLQPLGVAQRGVAHAVCAGGGVFSPPILGS